MTFYTAIGKYEFRKDKSDQKLSVIIVDETEYTLDILILFNVLGFERVFGHTDVSQILGIAILPAGEIIKN